MILRRVILIKERHMNLLCKAENGERETLSHLQQVTQGLRNYADEEIAQIR